MRKYLVGPVVIAGMCMLLGSCTSKPRPTPAHRSVVRSGKLSEGDLPTLNEESGLGDYLAYAALRNPGLESAFDRWRASLEVIPQAGAFADPQFTYSNYIETVETKVGPQEQKIALFQQFPWFGKLSLRKDIAGQKAKAQKALYDARKLKLFHDVKKTYYEYYFLGRAVAITEENLELLKYLESVTRTKYKTGQSPHSALTSVQTEKEKLEERLEGLRDLRKPVMAELNVSLGRRSGPELPWPLEISAREIEVRDIGLEDVLNGNPDLDAIDAEIAGKEAMLQLARKERYPDLSFGLSYILTGEGPPGMADSGKDPVIAMIGMTLPIWQRKYRAAEEQARREHSAAVNQREQKENELAEELEKALYGFRAATRMTDLYRSSLMPRAKQDLEVTKQGFKVGKEDIGALVKAHRTVLEMKLLHERSLTDRAKSLSAIETLIGQSVPRVRAVSREPGRSGL